LDIYSFSCTRHSLVHYLTNWRINFHFLEHLERVNGERIKDGFIVDDDYYYLTLLMNQLSQFNGSLSHSFPKIIYFTTLTSYAQVMKEINHSIFKSRILVLTKPFGPLKLLQALCQLLPNDQQYQCHQFQNSNSNSNSNLKSNSNEMIHFVKNFERRRDTVEVLVVEDNLVNQMVLKKILEKISTLYLVTASGEEALEIWRRTSPPIPIVILDVEVEGNLNGLQVASRIRRNEEEKLRQDPNYSRCLIIIMTGRANDEDKKLAFSSGCDEFLIKPVKLETIQKIISLKLRNWKSQ